MVSFGTGSPQNFSNSIQNPQESSTLGSQGNLSNIKATAVDKNDNAHSFAIKNSDDNNSDAFSKTIIDEWTKQKSGFLNKASMKMTYVHVKDGDGRTLLNISELSKKTNTSALKLFIRGATGNLDSNYVNDRENLNLIKKSVQKKAIKENDLPNNTDKISPKKAEKQIEKAIKTAKKISEKTSSEVLLNTKIGTLNYAVKISADKSVQVFVEKKVLGSGTFSIAKKVVNIASEIKTTLVLKEAKPSPAARSQLKNEYEILKFIHEKKSSTPGDLPGLPRPHYCLMEITKGVNEHGKNVDTDGILTERFDYDLTSDAFFKQSSYEERLKGSFALVQGLSILHELNIVHLDIKPENCSSKDGLLRLEDFGGAKTSQKSEELTPEVFLTKVGTLGSRSALYIHPGDTDQKLMEQAKTAEFNESFLDISKAHDVYSLGLTLLSNLSQESLETSYEEFKKRDIPGQDCIKSCFKALEKEHPEIAQLVGDMLKPRQERPSIAEVAKRYDEILKQSA